MIAVNIIGGVHMRAEGNGGKPGRCCRELCEKISVLIQIHFCEPQFPELFLKKPQKIPFSIK